MFIVDWSSLTRIEYTYIHLYAEEFFITEIEDCQSALMQKSTYTMKSIK